MNRIAIDVAIVPATGETIGMVDGGVADIVMADAGLDWSDQCQAHQTKRPENFHSLPRHRAVSVQHRIARDDFRSLREFRSMPEKPEGQRESHKPRKTGPPAVYF